MVLKCCCIWLSDGSVEKRCCTKIMVLCRTLLKIASFCILRKVIFWKITLITLTIDKLVQHPYYDKKKCNKKDLYIKKNVKNLVEGIKKQTQWTGWFGFFITSFFNHFSGLFYVCIQVRKFIMQSAFKSLQCNIGCWKLHFPLSIICQTYRITFFG